MGYLVIFGFFRARSKMEFHFRRHFRFTAENEKWVFGRPQHQAVSGYTLGEWFSNTQWKKRSERRKHCALAVVRRSQKISPHRRPTSRGRETAKI